MSSNWLNDSLRPTAGGYTATPFTVSEIDQHIDADRIWATILEAREEHENIVARIT